MALLCLKHAFNASDEEVIQRWSETLIWQYLTPVQEQKSDGSEARTTQTQAIEPIVD